MPLQDHRYKVTICKIERTDGGEEEFFDALVYHDLKYNEVLGLQATIQSSNIEELLLDAGIRHAKAKNIDLPPALAEAGGRGKSGRS